MRQTTELHFADGWRARLTAAGLDSFDAIMTGEHGELITRLPQADTRRLSLPPGDKDAGNAGDGEDAAKATTTAYLKRSFGERANKVISLLLRGVRPHVDSTREVQLLGELRARGFDCMNVIAWGERRTLGAPRCGFVLVEQAPGPLVADLLEQGDARREQALRSTAKLIARLHAEGFFQVVRFKDLIATDVPEDVERDLSLTLIDRAASWPWRRRFALRRCLAALNRGFARLRKRGVTMAASDVTLFADAYVEAMRERRGVAIDVNRVRRAVGGAD